MKKQDRIPTKEIIDRKTQKAPGPRKSQSPDTPDEQWRVMGHVMKANGEPVSASVSALNIKLSEKTPLGKVQTDKGVYVIPYQPEIKGSSSRECSLPDLLVEAYQNDLLIASSGIIYNAEKVTTVDLVVGNESYKGPAEYERLAQTLKPCLGKKDPATLNAADADYLANKTGANQEWIKLYVLAHRQSKLTKAAPPLFYACYRMHLPYGLNKLVGLPQALIKSRIQMAINENIIDAKWKATVDEFMSLLKNSSVKSALTIDETSTRTSLGKIFTQIKIPGKSQAVLLNLYARHREDTPAFWRALARHKTLGQYEKQLRLVLKVSALTQHHEPATKALMEHPFFARDTDISKLARLSSTDWTQIAKNIGSAPENIPGKGEEKLENYGRLMEKSIMSAFPTEHVAANIIQSDKYQDTELPKFFEVASDFSFEGTNIHAYVDKLNGSIGDKDTVIQDLSKLQRLYYLAPVHDRYKVMEILDKEGLASALHVGQYGRKAFINLFGSKFGSKALASNVFNKASSINATTMNVALQYNDLNGGLLPYVLQGQNGQSSKPGELELPDLGTLFGSQSFCSCKHCRSVYSAAAYFVDLLSYLKEHYVIDQDASTDDDPVYKESTGLDLLFERRPELGDILLNCENTNTVIPYLDIVNEVMENAVLSESQAYQTTSTSDELKANPEHINKEAYDENLAKEIFPFSQPFNLWNEEGKVYLEHLGIPRHEMMDTFQFQGNPNEPDDQAKYSVQLNLTENGRHIITGRTIIDSTAYSTKDFWGVTDARWRVALSKIRAFTDKAEITYEQLLEFLQLQFVNANGIIKIKFAEEAPCDIDQAVLAYWDESSQSYTSTPIHEKFFIRAHCFFRLRKKTHWSIFEQGRIMDSLGLQNITDNFIEQAAVLLQLQTTLNIEPLELASWWAALNTQSDENNTDDRSFYARHFLNKTVFDPQEINQETFVFTLNSDNTELKVTGNLISDYLNEIAAALNISSSDLLLLTETVLTPGGEIDDALTLKNLSRLFRRVSLTKALDISVEEYLIATEFIVANPFAANRPAELLSFVRQIEQVKHSGFSFAELQYLLLNQYNSADGIAPTEDRIIGLLTTMQDGLVKIQSEHEVPLDENGAPIDPTGELCKQKLSLITEEENITSVVAIVEAIDGLSPEHEADAAAYLAFLDVDQLISDFATLDYNTTEARYAYILERLLDYLIVSQSRSFVIQTLATDLAIDLDTSELLLTELIYRTDEVLELDIYAIVDFLSSDFAYHELEEGEVFELADFGIQHNTYLALYKSAMFINKFSLNAEEVSWAFMNGPGIGWVDLNAISGIATDVFLAWRKMEHFFHMREQYAEGDITFFDLMDYAADPALLEAIETGYEEEVEAFVAESATWTDADKNLLIFLSLLSEITGWESDSLFYLASPEAYNLDFENFKDEKAFYQMMKCFEVLNALGATAHDAWAWMAVDLTAENSANIKQSAKAKYNEAQWLEVAAPLRDVLREKQRDALTAYLIQNRGFEDENALYEYYLLDVETSACTMSSRIVLANSSVQLFVQRHLMNLESETLDLDADRWEWMKNYRVWEANRKVFLYPENWIEPDLRLVKSGFFTDLQNSLLQNDVTADLVETSIKDYLEKLDAVSNIKVCGTYHQYEEPEGSTAEAGDASTTDVLHVLGRTSSTPEEYFYRTYVDNGYWTSWAKVSLDIQSEQIIPIVLNNRLYLFWPEFTAKEDDITNIISESFLKSLEGIAEDALENIYSSNWDSLLTYDEYVETFDGVGGLSGEYWADYYHDLGLTQEAKRATYINDDSIQEYIDENYTFGTLSFYEIKLAYSEYKDGNWLPKKVSQSVLSTDTYWLALEILYGHEVEDVKDKVCFHTSIKSNHLEINCTQKIDLQESGVLLWNDQGHFKFYYDTKDILAEDTGLSNSIMEPAGTSIYFNSFKEESNSKLELITADVDSAGNYDGNDSTVPVLDLTPGTFRMPILHQYDEFVSQDNFFYGDDERNFFVKPYHSTTYTYADTTANPNTAGPHGVSTFDLDSYLQKSDIAVGIFRETSYGTHEIEEIIFDSGPKDQLDPIPPPSGRNGRHAVATKESMNGPVSTPELISVGTDTILDQASLNQQVEQFHFLGTKKYRFENFYHPYINSFIKTLNRDGVEALITRELQQQAADYFESTYLPTEYVHGTSPKMEVDFSDKGAMSIYNWELFFHIPMLVADRLSKNQRFEEAQRWYHSIFNPVDRSSEASPNKFWQFRPFFELYGEGEGASEDSIYNLLHALSYNGTDSEILDKKAEVEQQIDAWLDSPFDPHAIAALRPVAYMKSIVMKYIDNLIAWGDHLFRQDSTESINEATQIYILASQILGPRPELIHAEEPEARTYNQLTESGELDAFSNALVTLENVYYSESSYTGSSTNSDLLPKSLYFCIPNNPDLLAYWDTVEDRLFKIRHCMNIEGVVRQLPLFQPPIDPALLVKARAAGLSIGSVLNDLYAPLPHYRYRVMVQKALELCEDVTALGDALLSVLEKKDAEEMALLRAGHEIKLLQVVSDVKKLQLDEARETLSALKTMRKSTEARHDYYMKIEKLNSKEQLNLDKLEQSRSAQKLAEKNEDTAAKMHIIPNASGSVTFGAPPKVSVGASFGGSNLGAIANSYAAGHRNKSAQAAYEANKAALLAGYVRRWDEWKFQEKLASRDLDHIDKQIAAAEIRVAMMEKEMDNQQHQAENSREVSDLMTSKFTNRELYDWMTGQLSTVYFQSYQMAYDLAKRAQKCFQYELASDQTFIEFGYWDSLKKGLLAANKLSYDVRRMEVAFLDQSKRTFELTKSVSLAMLDPLGLVQLRENGSCYINLPEAIFDIDHPGHYMRRIKSIQLTIPCVTGPYTSINCKLTLLDNKWRKDSTGDDYAESTDDFDGRFIYNTGGTQSIATSSGQNDSGMFHLNFNDERYLPFEGTGAISNWRLEMPSSIRSFDFNTISDVIIQLNYTAKDGGDLLKDRANAALQESLMGMILGSENQGLTRMFSLKHEFSNEWYRFMNPVEDQEGQSALLNIGSEKFPFMFRENTIEITALEIMMVLGNDYTDAHHDLQLQMTLPSGQALKSKVDDEETDGITLSTESTLGGQLYQVSSVPFSEEPGEWFIEVLEENIPAGLEIEENGHSRLNQEAVTDLIVIFHYNLS